MKLLPPSSESKGGQIVKVDKFLPTKKFNIAKKPINIANQNKSNKILEIEKRVIKIDNLLKDFVSFKKNENKKRRKNNEDDKFKKREENLEKKKPKQEKNKNIIPMKPKLGIFGWLTNFITNVVLGFIFIRLIDHLPKLAALIPVINGVMNFIVDWGGKLLNGLVTFIDWGYSAYDNTVKVFEKFGGKESAKKFENFIGKFQDVIQYSLIAGMLFSDLAMSSDKSEDIIGDFDGTKSSGPYKYDQKRALIRKKYGDSFAKLYDQEIAKGLNSEQARKNVLSRYVKKGKITPQRMTGSLGGTDVGSKVLGRGVSRAPQRLAIKGLTATLGKGGAKQVLKFVRPFTKRLPIIGGLLDFGLSVAFGEDPGRAAFKAIGATLLGAVGAALGGPFALLTGFAGGWLGDQAGGALYDAFFKNKKEKKSSSNKQWFDPRSWFGMRSGGVVKHYASGGPTRGGQYQSETPTREIKTKSSKRRIILKPEKLKQGSATGGIKPLQNIFPEPTDIKSPQGTPSQNKNETMNPYGFLSHSYYRFASVPFIGPLLAMPLKVMMGDSIDSGYYSSIGQGFDSFLNKAYDEGAFSDDFSIEKFDIEKIVSKSVEELTVREMAKIRSDLMQQLMLEKLTAPINPEAADCPCPEPSGGDGGTAVYGDATDKAILDLISSVEAKDYDTMNVSRGSTAGKPTQMTVDWLAANANGAIGRYQQMPQFIKERVIAAGGKGSDKFTPELQDRTALKMLYSGHGYARWRSGQMSDDEFGNKLSATWRGLPHSSGGTYPDQYAGRNKAHMSRPAFMSSLARIRGGATPVNAQIASSSPAGSVSDCSCDEDNIPNSNGIDTATNPESYGDGKGKQIYLHWTAGSYSSVPRGSYHSIITGDGKVNNVIPYAQRGEHTYGRNTNSVGLSVAAMAGASVSNFGSSPVKPIQYQKMSEEVVKIAKAWGWSSSDINIKNVMTHAEAGSNKDGRKMHENYGPASWGGTGERWDLFKLFQNDNPGSGGDKIRSMIKAKMGSAGKFGGGPVNEGLTKVHPGEFVIDKDSVDAFGIKFMQVINQVENKSQLNRARQSLIQILKDIVPEYSENAPDQIVYNYIPRPSSNSNIVETTTNIAQGSSKGSNGNRAMDLLDIG
jgi:hypothetical protein